MEWKSNLRRTQSLKSFPSSCDKPIWTETGKKASVSQLVLRYQTTVAVNSSIQATTRNNGEGTPKPVLHEITPSLPLVSGPLETDETHPESLMKTNDERERSPAKNNLSRSRSMGSLQSSAGSINALKALFESKAATPIKLKSRYRAANVTSPSKVANILPVTNGGVEGLKSPAENQKTQSPDDATVSDAKTDAKEEKASRKVANQTRTERRRTIGGVDFEKVAASQADEKRRSIADFRDSSFNQTKEQLCVSVKAISALYLSKVAPRKPTHSLFKAEQDLSSESGKRVKITKMAEDSLQKKDDHLLPTSARHQPEPEDISGPHSQQFMPSQPSKEMLYQQRQKCELRRLLKHTHPELKMLDKVVDEELAEVLSSETGVTAAETGYEGEVLSRRLIFENCALSNKVSPYTPKLHMAEETAERGDVSKTSAVFAKCEKSEERPRLASVKAIMEADKTLCSSPESSKECEEEIVRIDVQATRRIFESQSVNITKSNPDNKVHRKISTPQATGTFQNQKSGFEKCSEENLHSKNRNSDTDLTEQRHKQGPCIHVVGESIDHEFSVREEDSTDETFIEDEPTSLPDSERCEEMIRTSAALLQNNPFISANVEREHSSSSSAKSQIQAIDSQASEDCLPANVKKRAHLFESMPFDKIKHQNEDDIETMVENIKETLKSLYHANIIHSDGSIIEVNETMIAKKAKFTLSETGPEIKYKEVAEGGAQNFIVQSLPRANLKPQITYLKEDCKGNMGATMVNVPVHQHHSTTSQDTEFKTANVVQLVEDILNQDNSLRKGVIIQEGFNRCAKVMVYSLYNYVNEKDVKSYCPPQGYCEESELGLKNGAVESTISCFQETSRETCSGSIRPGVTVKGNVKLFRSCIEKGDLEYLKTLQAESTIPEQELSPNQNVAGQGMELNPEQQGDREEESTPEWVPVDVKRLKCMFSGDQRPPQPKQSATISPAYIDRNVPLGNRQSSIERDVGIYSHVQEKNNIRKCGIQALQKVCNSEVVLHSDTHDENIVHQAELVKVVDDDDEISNLKTAIHSLHQATLEAKSFHQSSQEKHKILAQESSKEPVATVKISHENSVNAQTTEAELPQENAKKQEIASSITSENKLVNQQENTYPKDMNSVEIHTTETCSNKGQKSTEVVPEQHFEAATVSSNSSEIATQQEDEEIDFQGKLQAALDSLERSNINVTRGDFRAAMIYKKSSKERSQNVDAASFQKTTNNKICAVTEPKSNQAPLRQDVTTECPKQSESLNKPATSAASEKSKRPVCPKPAIPPKPEHLKVKQRDIQSTNTEIPQTITLKSEKENLLKEEEIQQTLTAASLSVQDQHKQEELSNINPGPDLEVHEQPTQNQRFGEASQMSQEIQVSHQDQGSIVTLENDITDKNIINQQKETNATAAEKSPQNIPRIDNINEPDESHVDFNEALKHFGGKKERSGKNTPVKPKRVKIAMPDKKNTKHSSGDNNSKNLADIEGEPQQTPTDPSSNNQNAYGQTADSKDKHEKEIKQEVKVEMREKKRRTETEDECRQRLSVHMDEIMRGNITAAMDIFDNLRKQEELQSILSQVEEIEEDTNEADASSLSQVFESVPDWVVDSNKRKLKKMKEEHKEKGLSQDNTESTSSMAHVFGDLERASEEIMTLKEQTLARLMDIEEAIKKALYSVSSLKSDSDIAGLSCLFKESLGTVSPSSGNISKISIGSSRKATVLTPESHLTQGGTAMPAGPHASLEIASAKQRASPPTSPAFISIQSAARKTDKTELLSPETATCSTCQHSPKAEEKFRTTKTLQCNSPAPNRKHDPRKGGQKQSICGPLYPERQLNVLEADHGGNSVLGNKTVTENYERTDSFGNRFYSSKTSTVVNTQSGNMTSFNGDPTVISPVPHQVTMYPEVRLPINQKPNTNSLHR